jgi:hypothetical protein
MSNSIFHVRPLDSGKGWAIDEYDGRGAWQLSVPIGPDGAPMDKIQAQRAVFQLRRKAVNSAKPKPPVNKDPCGDRCLDNPAWVCSRSSGHPGRHESADGGDWHDDGSARQRTTSDVACEAVARAASTAALLERAMELLDPELQLEAARRQDTT